MVGKKQVQIATIVDATEPPLPPPGTQVVCTFISPVKKSQGVDKDLCKEKGMIPDEVGHKECLAFFQELLDSLPPDGK
eukprot:491555-Ditylum_brightwellii.AAC.1